MPLHEDRLKVKKGSIVVALSNYDSNSKDELAVTAGEELKVLKIQDDSWWQAQSLKTKKKGWIGSTWVAPQGAIELFDWCHGSISRNASEYLLNRTGKGGSYLVRESQTQPGSWTISVFDGRKVLHYRITTKDGGHFVRSGEVFPTIPALIAHLQEDSTGIAVSLDHTVPKASAKAVVISKKVDKAWELKRGDIQLGKMLGQGQFGEVYVADYAPLKCQVAVKTVKEDTMATHEFMQEAHVMKKLQHPNLVRLIGVCSETMPMYIVTEFIPHGDLQTYLHRRSVRAEVDSNGQLYIDFQVAEGMAFLESQNVIHRDLAARNCLVADELVVKIADFGMGRVVDDLYTAHTGSKMPIKWSAPEALCYNAFSSKSDVWSFGILLWEVATFGESPYPNVDRTEVLPKLEGGYRMPKPPKCLPGLYTIMRSCWEFNTKDRPTFSQLKDRIARLQERPDWDGVVSEEIGAEQPPPPPDRPSLSAGGPTAAAAAPEPTPAPAAATSPPAAAPEPEAEEPEGDAAPATGWRQAYKQGDMDLEAVSNAIDLTKDVFGRSQRILRYGDDETLGDLLLDLNSAATDLQKALEPLSSHAETLAATKGIVSSAAAVAKAKAAMSKCKAPVEKLRNATKDLNKALKNLMAETLGA